MPPRFTFAVSDAQYLLTFAVMLTFALVIATLMASVRQQTRVAGARERRTALLYAMSRELAATRGSDAWRGVAVKHVAEVFQCRARRAAAGRDGQAALSARARRWSGSYRGADLAVAQWVADHGRRAGLGSDTLPAAPALYLPLGEGRRGLGVLAVLPRNPRRVLLPEQRHLLETFAGQIGLALERARLAETAAGARVAAERETCAIRCSRRSRTTCARRSRRWPAPRRRSWRAASTLDEPTRTSLARSIEAKAREMSELVSNVLDLMRFDSGEIALRRDWETVEDLVGAALAAERRATRASIRVEIALPADLPLVFVDATLIVQVFGEPVRQRREVHAAPARGSRLAAAADGGFVRVTVDDDGPGLPRGRSRATVRQVPARHPGRHRSSAWPWACRSAARSWKRTADRSRRGARPGGGARLEFTLPTTEPAA